MSSIIQFMSMQLSEQVASYLKLWIFTRGTEIGKGGPVLITKIGLARPILAVDWFFCYSLRHT